MECEYEWRYAPGPSDCEDLEGYQVGGYHPVAIGDQFCEGRYTIVHKLGCGGQATVWLAHEQVNNCCGYVAIKILTAASSEDDSNEIRIHNHLKQQVATGLELSSVALMRDTFWIEGPNGKHLCLTFDPAGPSLTILRRNQMKFRPDIAQDLAGQVAKGLQELHAAGVVYGDLSTNNLLLRLPDIDGFTPEELYERYGHPVPDEVQSATDEPIDAHAPKFVYEGMRFHDLDLDLLKAEIVFVDLADGSLMADSCEDQATGYSLGYTAPETLWFDQVQDCSSDIWALACIIFELRSGRQLLSESYGSEAAKYEIIDTIGPLPDSWIAKIAAGVASDGHADGPPHTEISTDCDADMKKIPSIHSLGSKLHKAWIWLTSLFRTPRSVGGLESASTGDVMEADDTISNLHDRIGSIGRGHNHEWFSLSLEERLAKKKAYYDAVDEEESAELTLASVSHAPPPAPLSSEEKADFEELLSMMLKWERADRPAFPEIIAHQWMKRTYGDRTTDAWLEHFNEGWNGPKMLTVEKAEMMYHIPREWDAEE